MGTSARPSCIELDNILIMPRYSAFATSRASRCQRRFNRALSTQYIRSLPDGNEGRETRVLPLIRTGVAKNTPQYGTTHLFFAHPYRKHLCGFFKCNVRYPFHLGRELYCRCQALPGAKYCRKGFRVPLSKQMAPVGHSRCNRKRRFRKVPYRMINRHFLNTS